MDTLTQVTPDQLINSWLGLIGNAGHTAAASTQSATHQAKPEVPWRVIWTFCQPGCDT